jgi:hypothetical protein
LVNHYQTSTLKRTNNANVLLVAILGEQVLEVNVVYVKLAISEPEKNHI